MSCASKNAHCAEGDESRCKSTAEENIGEKDAFDEDQREVAEEVHIDVAVLEGTDDVDAYHYSVKILDVRGIRATGGESLACILEYC